MKALASLVLCAAALPSGAGRALADTALPAVARNGDELPRSTLGAGRKPLLAEFGMLDHRAVSVPLIADDFNFALFDDGLVIFRALDDGAGEPTEELYSVVLDRNETAALRAELPGVDALAKLPSWYSCERLPGNLLNTSKLVAWDARGGRILSVCGTVERGCEQSGFPDHGSCQRGRIPAALVAAYDRLLHFHHARATRWRPDHVIVEFVPYDARSHGEAKRRIRWPDGLPLRESERATPTFFSVPGWPEYRVAPLVRLLAFHATIGADDVVVRDGRLWKLWVRYEMPLVWPRR